MLGHRLRLWLNIIATLGERLVFAGGRPDATHNIKHETMD